MLTQALAYYQAMNQKDLATMEKHLHPEVELIGPMANAQGKEDVVKALSHLLKAMNKLTVRAHFAEDNQVMLAYDIEFPDPIGISRAAVLLTFEDDLIKRYELFFDGSPFKMN